MKITCISDLHGSFPTTQGGDLLIVAGDLTARHTYPEYIKFLDWVSLQFYMKVILIGGNHDPILEEQSIGNIGDITYLCNSGTEFYGLKIWGCPYTTKFSGQNPDAMAFTVENDIDLGKILDQIPNDTQILITHSPPLGILDGENEYRCGSGSLRNKIAYELPMLKLHVFGHVHEGYGQHLIKEPYETLFVNASHMTKNYIPKNKPINIDLKNI